MANIKRANASGITKSGTAISDVPDAPTIGAVSDLGTGSTASVAYTAATTGGAATTFTATSSPGGFTGTGSSPITVSGLAESTAYTFTVTASNSTGSATSSTSSSLTLTPVGKYESIATATGTGSNSTLTLSSIPQTYKHLQIRYVSRDTSAITNPAGIWIDLNNDTAANYTQHYLIGNGSAASGAGNTAASTNGSPQLSRATACGGMAANIFGAGIIDIFDYSSTTKNKTIRAFTGTDFNTASTTAEVGLFSSVWLNSGSGVSTIRFYFPTGGNFATGSTFALYGIKGA